MSVDPVLRVVAAMPKLMVVPPHPELVQRAATNVRFCGSNDTIQTPRERAFEKGGSWINRTVPREAKSRTDPRDEHSQQD
jgi:hypothetical protein